ncbi:DUF1559 domain-containing protein, partial [Alienimonas sp. DA493]|uniref:DUF1559 family PulG-like putative transporter n=1 Tax=Alienimonas sp. DA493 TaxID=3373605 RepID=UPI003755105A
QQAREAARKSQCQNNLKQIGLAVHNFESTYGKAPPGWMTTEGYDASSAYGDTSGICTGTFPYLLPFLDLPAIDQGVHDDATNVHLTPDNTSGPVPGNYGGTRGATAWWSYDDDDDTTYDTWTTAYAKIPTLVCPSAQSNPPVNMWLTIYNTYNTGSGASRRFSAYDVSGSPAFQAFGRTTYLSMAGFYGKVNISNADRHAGMFNRREKVTFGSVKDGLTNTLMFGENSGTLVDGVYGGGPWNQKFEWIKAGPLYSYCGLRSHAGTEIYNQNQADWDLPFALDFTGGACRDPESSLRFQSDHSGVTQFVMGDGSVQSIADTTDYLVYIDLSGMADGDVLENNAF